MRKLLAAMTVTVTVALILIIASCANKPKPLVNEMVYRGSVPDSIVLREHDIEKIAELVHYKQAEVEYTRSQNNGLLKIAGTLITLLLAGLVWFLRQMLMSIPKLQTEVNKLSFTIAASEQWNKDQKSSCEERHRSIEKRLENLNHKT